MNLPYEMIYFFLLILFAAAMTVIIVGLNEGLNIDDSWEEKLEQYRQAERHNRFY